MADYYVIGLVLIYAGVLFGYFYTKRPGFGPFNTSILILILVLMIASIGFLSDKFQSDDLSKILFALIGFAAGLFARRESSNKNNDVKA